MVTRGSISGRLKKIRENGGNREVGYILDSVCSVKFRLRCSNLKSKLIVINSNWIENNIWKEYSSKSETTLSWFDRNSKVIVLCGLKREKKHRIIEYFDHPPPSFNSLAHPLTEIRSFLSSVRWNNDGGIGRLAGPQRKSRFLWWPRRKGGHKSSGSGVNGGDCKSL